MTVGLAELGQGHLSTLTPACFIRTLVPQLGLGVTTDEVIPSTLEDGIRTPPRGTIEYSEKRHTHCSCAPAGFQIPPGSSDPDFPGAFSSPRPLR